MGWGRGAGAWVIWPLIQFSFDYAKAASDFQMVWELLITPGRHFLAKTSCLCRCQECSVQNRTVVG